MSLASQEHPSIFGEREVLHMERTDSSVSRASASFLRALGSPPTPANQSRPAAITLWTSALVRLSRLSEETPPKLTVIGLGEHLDRQPIG